MKRSAWLVLAGILASYPLASMSYYVLELRGGSHIYATDVPVRKGRLTLFHRYPDGAYMSVSSSELVKVETAQEPPPAAAGAEKFAPGDVRYIGGALHGPGQPAPQHPAPGEPPAGTDSGYGYSDYGYGYGYGGGGGYVPPRPAPRPPAGGPNIGPNGFPIIAPQGSPGSVPPPIGSNGYPIIAPQPPVAAPRRPS
jgi:hypothetical protein